MKVTINVSGEDENEFRGQLVDVVEDYLDAKVLSGDWRVYRLENGQPGVMVSGRDYDKLAEAFMTLLQNWSNQSAG